MLSSPPRSFAALISAWVAASRSPRFLDEDPRDRRRRRPSSSGRPSRAGRRRRRAVSTVNASTSTSASVPSARVITERCGWTCGLLGGELAAPHELGDERVVVGQLLELAVAQPVGARVADVPDRDRAVGLRGSRPSSSCPSPRRPRRRSARWCTRRFAAWISATTRSSPRELGSRLALGDGRRGERRGDLAGLRAAHPVGDREQRRRARRTCPRCAAACARRSTRRTTREILTARTSGRSRRSGRRRRATSRRSRVEADAVDERAVRRADVLDVDAVAARLEARVVAPRRTRRRRSAGRCRCRGRRSARSSRSRITSPSGERRALDDDEPAELARRRAARGGRRPAGARGSSIPAAVAGRVRPSGRSAR